MRVGFIGLGLMGSGMALRLAQAGVALCVYDLAPDSGAEVVQAGAIRAESLADLAATSDLILTSLPKPSDVADVARAIGPDLRPGTLWFDLSTNAPDVVRDLHDRLGQGGIRFLDAPVSGGPKGAASGKLAIWVGGPRSDFEAGRKVLEHLADRPRYVGEIGAGSIAKLVHNTIATTINHAIAEMMTVGVKAGMEPLELFEAIRSGAMGRMRAFDGVAPRWLAGNLEPATFALELLHKDVALGVDLAEKVGVPAPLATLARDDLAEGLARGWAGRDAQAALTLAQDRAGLEPILAPPEAISNVLDRT